MALKQLVRYVSRCCAQKPNCRSLYELAAKYDWDAEDVQAFLRVLSAGLRSYGAELPRARLTAAGPG